MIPASFITAVVFSLVFFGVYCWKDGSLGNPPACVRPFIVGSLFVLLALVISILVK